MADTTRFSKKTIDFLAAAGNETSPDWLNKHKKEHQEYLISPLSALAEHLAEKLGRSRETVGYRFPLRGFGRLRRPKHKIQRGQAAYRNWVHLRATRPSASLFDENPGLYFYLSNEEVFAGGGLYDASSRQIKQIRAWLAEGPPELNHLFRSKAFKKIFPRGFETKKSLKTFPRMYPQDHKHIDWLRLQAFYVTQKYTRKELFSADFKDMVTENWRQTLRLNEHLYAHFTVDPWKPNARPVEDLPESMDEENVGHREDLWDERL